MYFLASCCVCLAQGRQREPWNLVLRHTVPVKTIPFRTFRRIIVALRVQWRNLTPIFNQSILKKCVFITARNEEVS